MSYADAVKRVRSTSIPATGKPSFSDIVKTTPTVKSCEPPQKTDGTDFNWSEFAAFLVKISATFSKEDYQVKTEIEKLAIVADLISNFFQVQVKRNEACHALFTNGSNVNVPSTPNNSQ